MNRKIFVLFTFFVLMISLSAVCANNVNDTDVQVNSDVVEFVSTHDNSHVFRDTQIYQNASDSNQSNITKLNTKLSLSSNASGLINSNSSVLFNVSLFDENGTALNNSVVKLIDTSFGKSKVIGSIIITNGTGSFVYTPKYSELLNIHAFYEGTKLYSNSSSEMVELAFTFGVLSYIDIYLIIHFTDIQSITLNRDLVYNSTKDNDLVKGIEINRPITIDGNGYVINGNKKAALGSITSGANVLFKNTILTGLKGDLGPSNGQVITVINGIFSLKNSTVKDISNTYSSPLFHVRFGDLNVDNCTFINNSLKSTSLFTTYSNMHIQKSLFINNFAINTIVHTQVGISLFSYNTFFNNSCKVLVSEMDVGEMVGNYFGTNDDSKIKSYYSVDESLVQKWADSKLIINGPDKFSEDDNPNFEFYLTNRVNGAHMINSMLYIDEIYGEFDKDEIIISNNINKVIFNPITYGNTSFSIYSKYGILATKNIEIVKSSLNNYNLSLNIDETVYGETLKVNVVLKDIAGNLVSGNVVISINKTKYSLNIVNGYGQLDVPNLVPGIYKIITKVMSSDSNYRNTTILNKAKVNLGILNINLTTSEDVINDEYPVTLTATVTNSVGNIIANKVVYITDNGNIIGAITTDENGKANYTVYPNAGIHNFVANMAKSNLYDSAKSNNVAVKVNSKIGTKLTLTSNSTELVDLGTEIKFTVKFTDVDNNPLVNRNISIYNNENLLANVITDKNGMANFLYSQNVPGILNVVAKFPVDMKYYSASSNKINIAVAPNNSFLALSQLIHSLENNTTLNLDHDYIFTQLSDESCIDGIVINKNIKINGNGHKIDGKNLARIFDIKANVVLNNITIVNSLSHSNGAIFNDVGSVLNIVDCIFENNSLENDKIGNGGAIYNSGFLNVSNSLFKNNQIRSINNSVSGGAIFNGVYAIAKIFNCTFENNSLITGWVADGGALANYGVMDILESIFVNNWIKGDYSANGGAIYFGQAANATLISSILINNSAISLNKSAERGGAFLDDSYVVCLYNIFINNNASVGSTAHFRLAKGTVDYNYWGTNDNFENMAYGADIKNNMLLVIKGNNLTYTTIPTEYIIKFEGKHSDKLPNLQTFVKLLPTIATLNCSVINISNNGVKVLLLSNVTGNLTLIVGPEFNNLTTLNIEIKKLVKKNYTMTIDGDKFTSDDDIFLKIILVDADGNGIDGIVYYTFNNETKSVELKHGEGGIYLGKLATGDYTILFNYTSVDLFYNDISVIKSFKVIKSNLTMNVNISNIKYGEDGTIEVDLPELADGNITFIIKGIFNETVEVKLGHAYCRLPILDAGKYDVMIIYSGNELYNSAKTNATFTIGKSNPQLNVIIPDVKYGDVTVVNVTLTAGNIKLNGTVKVNINAKNYIVNVVNGVGSIVIDKLPVGSYNVLAIYNGNSNVNAISNKTVFNVNKGDFFMNVSIDEVTEGNDEIIRITVPKDATGNVWAIINNKKYGATIEEGNAIITIPGLSKGEYDVSIIYEGNKIYNKTSLNTTFFIKSGAPNIIINAKNIIYGDDLVVSASINSNATGNITFIVNGISQVVKIINGEAKVTFKGLNAGIYDVIVKYSGDKYYASTQKNTKVNVDKAPAIIDIIISDIIEGEPVNITAIINKDATGNIIFEIPGFYNPRDKAIINGSALWVISPLTSGEYVIIAKYDGDNNYLATSTTKIINYNQTKTILDVDVVNNGNITIKANLTTVDGQKITAWVYVTIKNVTYKVPVFNGTGYLNIGKLDGGVYNYSAVFKGTNLFIKSTVNGTFEVPFFNLNVPYLIKYYSADDRLVAILTDNLGNPISGKNITFEVNGVKYIRTTDNKGVASMAINLKPGIYKVSAYYENIVIYSGITVKSTIEGNNIIKMYQNGTQFFAKFFDKNGNIVANKDITFNINGVLYTRTTNGEGIAKLFINLRPGNYILTAINVNGEQKGFNITVKSLVQANDLTKYFQNASKFEATIYNKDGSLAANKEVTFNINGVFYKRTTNDKGVVSLAINLRPGTYTITTMYGGLDVGNKVNVLPTLETKDLSMKFQDGSKFTAKTVNGQGKPLANQNVTFNVNGVFYHRVSDANGIASLNINLIPGEYVITSIWNNFQVGNKITIA